MPGGRRHNGNSTPEQVNPEGDVGGRPLADPQPDGRAGDHALTAARAELKYLVDGHHAGRVTRALDTRLTRHVHRRDSPLAGMAQHYTTTVYFDTADQRLYRAARDLHDHVKLRAREYYEVLPLAELATDERSLVRSDPILWLELKQRNGDQSDKRRVGVPKRRLTEFFERQVADAELRAIQRRAHGEEGEEVLEEVLSFLQGFDEPLRPSCIVNYRRSAWQNPAGTLRVTLDHELAVFRPRDAFWAQAAPLTRKWLGAPAKGRDELVLEIKHLEASPAWIDQLLADVGARSSGFSKFVMASAALAAEPSGYTTPPPGPSGT